MRKLLLAAVMFGAASGAQAADMPDFLRGSLPRGPGGDGQLAGLLHRRSGGLRFGQLEFRSPGSMAICRRPTSRRRLFPIIGRGWARPTAASRLRRIRRPQFAVGRSSSVWKAITCTTDFSSLTTATGLYLRRQLNRDVRDFKRVGKPDRLRIRYVCAAVTRMEVSALRLRRRSAHGEAKPSIADISASPAPLGPPDFLPLSNIDKHQHCFRLYCGCRRRIHVLGSFFLRAEYEFQRVAATVDSRINSVHVGLGYKF